MGRPASVHDLVQSHRITAVIYAAAKLNLAEAIGGEAKSVAELARLVSADESALRRLLVALSNKLARIAWAVLNKGRAFASVKTEETASRPA
jgi:hypothetical protein